MRDTSLSCGTSYSHCFYRQNKHLLFRAELLRCISQTLKQQQLLQLLELFLSDWVRVPLTFSHFTETVLKRPSQSPAFYGRAFPRSHWPDGYYQDKSNFHANTLIHSRGWSMTACWKMVRVRVKEPVWASLSARLYMFQGLCRQINLRFSFIGVSRSTSGLLNI